MLKNPSELHAEEILLDLQKRGISASVSLSKCSRSNQLDFGAQGGYKANYREEQKSSGGKGKVVKCAICYETIYGDIADHLNVHRVSHFDNIYSFISVQEMVNSLDRNMLIFRFLIADGF